MSYAVKADGSYRAVDPDWELTPDEVFYAAVPQWAVDKMEATELRLSQILVEDAWRKQEMAFIADQLIALEDGDPDAHPVTDADWRAYRTAVRAWKVDGNASFPDLTQRPVRPAY